MAADCGAAAASVPALRPERFTVVSLACGQIGAGSGGADRSIRLGAVTAAAGCAGTDVRAALMEGSGPAVAGAGVCTAPTETSMASRQPRMRLGVDVCLTSFAVPAMRPSCGSGGCGRRSAMSWTRATSLVAFAPRGRGIDDRSGRNVFIICLCIVIAHFPSSCLLSRGRLYARIAGWASLRLRPIGQAADRATTDVRT
jgi:hypothetical protein